MIYLASASPRRQELLRQIGVAFEVLHPQVPEQPRSDEAAEDYVRRVARDKALAGLSLVGERGLPPRPLLAADTEVVLDGEVLGKPRDRAHGLSMLRRLADRSHRVLTAVLLVHDGREFPALSVSEVSFGALTDADIEHYWSTGEPVDKAGAYAVQGRAAGFIGHLSGSYSGVMGLPLYEVVQVLSKAGIAWP